MNNFLKPWPTRLTHRIQGTFGRIIFIPTVFGAIFLDSLMTGTRAPRSNLARFSVFTRQHCPRHAGQHHGPDRHRERSAAAVRGGGGKQRAPPRRGKLLVGVDQVRQLFVSPRAPGCCARLSWRRRSFWSEVCSASASHTACALSGGGSRPMAHLTKSTPNQGKGERCVAAAVPPGTSANFEPQPPQPNPQRT